MSEQNIVTVENAKLNQSSFRHKVAFYLEDTNTPFGLLSSLAVLSLIFLSSGIFVAETYPIGESLQDRLKLFDSIILVIFTIEYFLRLWIAEKPKNFFFSFLGLIDLVAILPLLLGWADIRFIRVFRCFRILRILRFWQIEKKLFGIKTEDSVIFMRIFLTLFTIIFVYAGLIYQVEHQVNSDHLHNFFDAFYFVVVTMTTVGYGDVTPLSQAGRFMTVLMIFTGVLFIPWQLRELIAQVVKTSNSIEQQCSSCNLSHHESDASFCKRCGTKLKINNQLSSKN